MNSVANIVQSSEINSPLKNISKRNLISAQSILRGPHNDSIAIIGKYLSYNGYFNALEIQKIQALNGTKYIQECGGFALPSSSPSPLSILSNGSLKHSTYRYDSLPSTLNVEKCNSQKNSSDLQVHQPNPSWGLSRLCSEKLPVYMYNGGRGFVSPNSGENIVVYVIDTGVNINHVDFGGRASFGANFVKNVTTGELLEDDYDHNGHGTMVASLVAGCRLGVAKKSRIISYKVAGKSGNGDIGAAVKALGQITKDIENAKDGRSASIVVCSFLFLGQYISWNDALVEFTNLGHAYFAPAGNQSDDSCGSSPIMSHAAIVVGASDPSDGYMGSTSFGRCVDIFAPGVDITGASNTNITGTAIKTGTSFSAPLVAGIGALILSNYPNLSPAQLKAKLIEYSVKNILPSTLVNTTNILAQIPSSF
ncbi:Subtilisin-like protease [Smittium mucronatum]|uniref:Subtilisin-like protease n=1 Tax=Smittium mucronatum TaxID=133383 RepID=A0A1R0H435_9FUNG|nr:Subtilisin-like protease [Smittium mucronatum]